MAERATKPEQATKWSLARQPDADGGACVWEVALQGNLHGWYYWYVIDGVREGRGRFEPTALDVARSTDGYRSLGHAGGIRVGAWCDLVEVDTRSVRTVGAAAGQLALVATASDVRRVLVGGRVVAAGGMLAGRPRAAHHRVDALQRRERQAQPDPAAG